MMGCSSSVHIQRSSKQQCPEWSDKALYLRPRTNHIVLSVSPLPLVFLALLALMFPERALRDSTALWITSFAGLLVFWVWGIGPHLVMAFIGPMVDDRPGRSSEAEGRKEKTRKLHGVFRFLRIYLKEN